MTRLASHSGGLPSDSRAGMVTGFSVTFLTVIWYSPSPSGLPYLRITLGGTGSAVNSTPSPTRRAGRPVAQAVPPLAGGSPAHAVLPSFAQGETRRPSSTDQPTGTAQARSACASVSALASSTATTTSFLPLFLPPITQAFP